MGSSGCSMSFFVMFVGAVQLAIASAVLWRWVRVCKAPDSGGAGICVPVMMAMIAVFGVTGIGLGASGRLEDFWPSKDAWRERATRTLCHDVASMVIAAVVVHKVDSGTMARAIDGHLRDAWGGRIVVEVSYGVKDTDAIMVRVSSGGMDRVMGGLNDIIVSRVI